VWLSRPTLGYEAFQPPESWKGVERNDLDEDLLDLSHLCTYGGRDGMADYLCP
jgi:hypothetical protein